MRHIEDEHQRRLFEWARFCRVGNKRLFDLLYAIPNGGKRNAREAARMKAQGVKAGVSDIHLPIACGEFIGLWIELKKPIVKGQSKPRLSDAQKNWLELMAACGHRAVVCYGFDEAKCAIEDYLSGGVRWQMK